MFYDLLLAEAEHMVMSNPTSNQDTSTPSKPHVKALQTNPNSKGRDLVCKYWGTESGCRAGRTCKYQHDWYSLTDRNERCWGCSSKGHRKVDCPVARSEELSQSATGGSAPQDSRSTTQEGGKGKAKGKDKKGNKGKANPASSTKQEERSTNEAKGSEATEQGGNPPSIKAAEKSSQVKEEANSGTSGQEALVSEVTSLLRSLRVEREEPRIKMMQVKSIEQAGAHTLIDGGATHCLRQSKSQKEWQQAQEVKVRLAAGEAKMKQCQETGTLLVEEPIQAIIPVAKLTENGYFVRWDREACRIEHARQGKIPLEMSQGCPTVNEVWGKRLMEEVEEAERKKARIRAIMGCGVMAEDEYEKRVAELQALFPQVPLRILERIPGEKHWDPDQLPFNRRRRRQVQRARAVIINMCSGSNTQRWREMARDGVVVLNLDVLLGVNVMDPHVAGWLESVIDSGKVMAYTAGPPCRSVSLCRQRAIEDGGPKPVRSRDGPERFGLQGITASMQDMADHDAALWLKNLWYMRRVKHRNQEAEVMLEQPQDPQEWCPWAKECPTFLNWPETRSTIQALSLTEVRFCQGGIGHATPKPTTLATDMPELLELEGIKSKSMNPTWPGDLQQRMQMSRSLAEWAPGLVAVIKKTMHRLTKGPLALKALTAKEREAVQEWRAHVEMNHTPYRRDCGICVETMGRDRPRRRQKKPEPFTLALDIAGPYVPGKDQIPYQQPRYILAGVMTIPLWQGRPLVQGLRRLAGDQEPMADIPCPPEERGQQSEPDGAGVATEGREEPEDPFRAIEDLDEEAEENPFKEGSPEEEREVSEGQAKELDERNQKWKDFMADTEEMPVQSLTMAVPIRSRKYEDVIKGVARIVARMRALHIPLNRIHTDTAQEFCGKEFQKWIQSRDLWHTTTAGDEPSSNARAENHLKLLQGRTRTLMKTAKCDVTYWPLALRYASEEKFRSQLRACGVPAPAMIPFGIAAYAKKKQWQDKHQMWRTPMMAVRVWGPAHDMSMTSKGYFLETTDKGTFMRSTVVVVPKRAPAIADAQAIGEASPNILADPQNPRPDEENEALLYSPSIGPDEAGQGDLLEEDPDTGEVELELDTPTSMDRGIPAHDPPLRRLNGKQAAPLYDSRTFPPTLRQVQVGGEWTGESARGEAEDAQEQCKERRRREKQEELMLVEHEGMVNWVKEERCIARDPGTLQTVLSIETEISRLEKTLEEQARIRKIEVEEEVLQTRVIPPEEVRQDMEGWRPVFQKEYDMLIAGPVTPIFEEEMRDMEKKQVPMEVLPAKAIASKKPPNRRKGRVVVCGNFTEDRDGQNISVGGVCAMAVRGVVHAAACKGWTLGSIDVAGAFLQAPRREKATLTVVQPPKLLQQLQITKPHEKWLVNCALYGFVESPADWANHRNDSMKKMKWEKGKYEYWLERTPEQHLWKVNKRKKDEDSQMPQTAGWVAVYVDDFLVAMHAQEIAGLFEAIKSTWKCSEEEYVKTDKGMRFCGYEIRARETGGFEMTQEGYIRDLIERYKVEGTETSATPKVEDEEDEENPKPSVIKEAQGLCGELLWIAGRTRPDTAYGVGLMSRMIHRRPSLVVALGHHMLRYLRGTPGVHRGSIRGVGHHQGPCRHFICSPA